MNAWSDILGGLEEIHLVQFDTYGAHRMPDAADMVDEETFRSWLRGER